MRTLYGHLILFDAECPMCQLYTKAFVSAGLLENNGRVAYQNYAMQPCPNVNWQRAVNEIALLNQETGEVTYGIESLLKICSVAVPVLKPLFQFGPFIWLMSKLYAFISYNRRVIIPAPVNSKTFPFQPAFRRHYRIAYLVFTWFVTAYILSQYGKLLIGILPTGLAYREYLVCGGQIFFQALVIHFYKKEKKWEYLGNLMTISFAGALLLFPILMISKWLTLDPYVYFGWFGFVVGLMFLEHIRRSKLLHLGIMLTASWILYRVIVLFLIFIGQ